MKNFFINNTQIHDNASRLGYFIKPGVLGLEMPDLRLSVHERPNVDGAFVPAQLYGARVVSFVGFVHGDTVNEYRTNRRVITSLFKIRRSGGELLPLSCKFTTLDNLALQFEAYTSKFKFPDEGMTSGEYTTHLLVPDPVLYTQEAKTKTLYIFSGGGMAVPTAIPMDMGVNATTQESLSNGGDLDAYPTITLYGPLTNPTLTNETNGDQLNLTYTLSSGQFIVIDTKNRTALYYSSDTDTDPDNVLDNVSGDFLRLSPGSNTIKLTDSVYNASGKAQFNWRDPYSGV